MPFFNGGMTIKAYAAVQPDEKTASIESAGTRPEASRSLPGGENV